MNFSIAHGIRYEDNLYRLSEHEAAPEDRRHDVVNETTLGLKFDRLYGRQRLVADLNLVSARYSIHDNLNHDSPDLRVAWDWALGNRWSGLFSHMDRESLTNFEESSGFQRNLNTYVRTQASADYWWHPRWATGLAFAHIRNRFDQESLKLAEFDQDILDFNLTYRPPTGNRAVLTFRDSEGQYPNRPAVAGSIRDFRQQEIRLGGEWQLTGATRLTGFVGQTRVSYRFAPERDFSGAIGRLGVLWQATPKTSLAMSVRREVGAQQDVTANYAVTEAFSVTPKWAISDKLSLGAGFDWWRRDYRGDPGAAAAGAPSRGTDRNRRYGLQLEYKPVRALDFLLTTRRQERIGAQSSSRYSADSVELAVRFQF